MLNADRGCGLYLMLFEMYNPGEFNMRIALRLRQSPQYIILVRAALIQSFARKDSFLFSANVSACFTKFQIIHFKIVYQNFLCNSVDFWLF